MSVERLDRPDIWCRSWDISSSWMGGELRAGVELPGNTNNSNIMNLGSEKKDCSHKYKLVVIYKGKGMIRTNTECNYHLSYTE